MYLDLSPRVSQFETPTSSQLPTHTDACHRWKHILPFAISGNTHRRLLSVAITDSCHQWHSQDACHQWQHTPSRLPSVATHILTLATDEHTSSRLPSVATHIHTLAISGNTPSSHFPSVATLILTFAITDNTHHHTCHRWQLLYSRLQPVVGIPQLYLIKL